jgi:hypothetical protein
MVIRMGFPVKACVSNLIKMNRTVPVDKESLRILGFNFNGHVWVHSQEAKFAIKLEDSCFFISFHGYLAKYPYDPVVKVLEDQFFERTGKLLF